MSSPKRWLVHGFIGLYLGSLGYGILAHTLQAGTGAHPAMYFVVWDMFCGWSAWEQRNQLIAEGESGAYYDVGATPWSDFRPYGSLERRHYDATHQCSIHLAKHVLRHTKHEPITRIFVVEESWPKRYNLPDELWFQRLNLAKDREVYSHTRFVTTDEGAILHSQPGFINFQNQLVLGENPRLRADSRRTQPFLTVPANGYRGREDYNAVGAPLGN